METLKDESFEKLTTKTCQYGGKLLKKPDQARAACLCANLFWPLLRNVNIH